MDRRRFLEACSLCSAAALMRALPARAAEMQDFPRATLVDAAGVPLRASAVGTDQALVFAYPYAGVPCFLINLGERHPGVTADLTGVDGNAYAAPAGVGPKGNLVAFIAICTHQMTYPTPEVSAFRYAAGDSDLAGVPGRIVCCAHASVFDPASGGQTVSGPAPNPLLPVRLAHDPKTDSLAATGTIDGGFFERFFAAYKPDLIKRFGPGGYRQDVGETSTAIPLDQYSAFVLGC
ncbi:MAG: Rieske 2Fe-2S domain-containing protein [Gemmatimonadaceae bacterium]|nr:Rieske 2Fe-2S domain-containing protein [Gemmatimonadaceae bacterium]